MLRLILLNCNNNDTFIFAAQRIRQIYGNQRRFAVVFQCENPKEIRYGSSVVLGCCQVNEHYKPGSQSCVSCAPRWTNCAKNTEIQCSHHLVFW